MSVPPEEETLLIFVTSVFSAPGMVPSSSYEFLINAKNLINLSCRTLRQLDPSPALNMLTVYLRTTLHLHVPEQYRVKYKAHREAK